MLDRTTTLQTYQTYIDGKWVDAASGKTFQTFDPYTGEPWALIPECDKADVDRAVEAASRAFESGPWPKMTPTARGKIMRRIAELIEKHAEHLGQIEVRDNGKLISEMAAQTKYMPEWFYYYGGLADKIQGAVVPVDRPDHFNYILQGAGRRVRVHHAVELAADAGGLEAGAGAGGRLHRGHQAVGVHLRLAARVHEAGDRGVRPAARRGQRRHRLRRGGRRAAGDASQGRQGRLHRRHADRRPRQRAGGQDLQEGVAGARRQVAQHRVRRLHPRRCRERRGLRHLRGHRPDLHRRLAPAAAGDASTTSSSRSWWPWPRRRGSAIRRWPRRRSVR